MTFEKKTLEFEVTEEKGKNTLATDVYRFYPGQVPIMVEVLSKSAAVEGEHYNINALRCGQLQGHR